MGNRWQIVACLTFIALVNIGCAGPTNQQFEQLKEENRRMQAQIDGLYSNKVNASLGVAAATPSSLPTPGALPLPDSKLINDINCRRKLVFVDDFGNPLSAPSKSLNDLEKSNGEKDQNDKLSPPTPIGTNVYVGLAPAGTRVADTWPGCHELNPVTRLVTENAILGASDAYTNQAGIPGGASSIVQQEQNVYQFGIGYAQKPILKQLRRLLDINDYDDEPDPAITNQGSWAEDFIFNAVLLNAGTAYGESLVLKNGQATTTSYSQPIYSVGVTYALDLERAYAHVFHGYDNSRPADPGYYFTPGTPAPPAFPPPPVPASRFPYTTFSPGFWPPQRF